MSKELCLAYEAYRLAFIMALFGGPGKLGQASG